MTKIQVGHVDKNWSNLGQLRFDQDFTSWPRFDQHFTIGNIDLDQDLTNALVKTSPKSTPSNLSHNDKPLTKIRLRILGLGYECIVLQQIQKRDNILGVSLFRKWTNRPNWLKKIISRYIWLGGRNWGLFLHSNWEYAYHYHFTIHTTWTITRLCLYMYR